MARPRRIVSLVPSLTEAVVGFGLIDSLAGRTRYCVEPAGVIEAVASFGGTKNPDVEAIVGLEPDLVIVNKEENRIEDCRALEEAGISLHVTHPRTVAGAVRMLEDLAARLGVAAAQAGFISECRRALGRAEDAVSRQAPLPGFCPIWRKPWMTFATDTYIGDMLRLAGVANLFGGRGDQDFFTVELSEVVALGPEVVLLPDEPYAFGPRHARELREAGVEARFVYIDGKELAWYGPRLPGALARLPALVAGG